MTVVDLRSGAAPRPGRKDAAKGGFRCATPAPEMLGLLGIWRLPWPGSPHWPTAATAAGACNAPAANGVFDVLERIRDVLARLAHACHSNAYMMGSKILSARMNRVTSLRHPQCVGVLQAVPVLHLASQVLAQEVLIVHSGQRVNPAT
jgi:hypothetical protein